MAIEYYQTSLGVSVPGAGDNLRAIKFLSLSLFGLIVCIERGENQFNISRAI